METADNGKGTLRRAVASVVVGAFATMSGTALAQPAATCEAVVNVGGWNVQWLGNAKAGKRDPQRADDVAAYIAAGKVAVLALSEISATSQSGGQARNNTLDEAFALLNKSGGQWKYLLFDKREGARDPQDQWLGLAWNEAVVKPAGGPWKLDVAIQAGRESELRANIPGSGPEPLVLNRWPRAMKFSAGEGRSDFVIVPVHLKSNIGGAGTADVRGYEAELILEGLAKLKSSHADEDLIVLGDTNMLAAGEPAAQKFAGAGLKDCNAKDLGTHIAFGSGEKAAPFDRIFIPAQQPETRSSCSGSSNGSQPLDFRIVRAGEWIANMKPSEFRKRLSDHMMVRFGICVGKDDD